MNIFLKAFIVFGLVFVILNLFLIGRFYLGKKDITLNNRYLTKSKIEPAPVEHLNILPVVDLMAVNKDLKTEPGTSFLIETDNDSVLFDVGFNRKKEEASPLMHNLKELDKSLENIDTLAISHNHADHVGGLCYRKNRVELTNSPVDLKGKKIYTPVPMTCDTTTPKTVNQPMLIGKDVASTGPLAQQMFIPGRLNEQSLLVNVKGKGLVLISGCGHPGVITMVRAAQQITGIPVYAVVGGLHLYYTRPAAGILGNIFGSSKLYCGTPNREEIVETVDELKKLGVQKVYISPHDADQPTLEIFADRFGRDYDMLQIGKPVSF